MGKVRTKTIKRAARKIVENNYESLKPKDFQNNKAVCSKRNVAIIPSKRLRNKVAGYVTTLMNRVVKGPVHGISLRLQEEERERRDNYAPKKSEFDVENITVSGATQQMIDSIGFKCMSTSLKVADPTMRKRSRDHRE